MYSICLVYDNIAIGLDCLLCYRPSHSRHTEEEEKNWCGYGYA